MKKRKKYVDVVGITDNVYYIKGQKKISNHVFFFEIDTQIYSEIVKKFADKMASKYECCIFILQTRRGLHFVSFNIFETVEHMRMFADFLEFFNWSDYNYSYKSTRILRLGHKGKSPPPEFIYRTQLPFVTRNYSNSHADKYVQSDILKDKDLVDIGCPVKTLSQLCIYKSRKGVVW